MCTRSASSLLHTADSRCPGNYVLKILNLDLTYNTSYVSLQSRNRITGWRNAPLFWWWVSGNVPVLLHLEGTCGQGKKKGKKDDSVSDALRWCDIYIPWQRVTNHLHSCYIVTPSTALMGFVKMWATRKSCKTWLQAMEQFGVEE